MAAVAAPKDAGQELPSGEGVGIMPDMAQANGTKAKRTATNARSTKIAAKKSDEIARYERLIEENETRLAAKTNAKGEPLSGAQTATLREVIEKQRARLDELTGE